MSLINRTAIVALYAGSLSWYPQRSSAESEPPRVYAASARPIGFNFGPLADSTVETSSTVLLLSPSEVREVLQEEGTTRGTSFLLVDLQAPAAASPSLAFDIVFQISLSDGRDLAVSGEATSIPVLARRIQLLQLPELSRDSAKGIPKLRSIHARFARAEGSTAGSPGRMGDARMLDYKNEEGVLIGNVLSGSELRERFKLPPGSSPEW